MTPQQPGGPTGPGSSPEDAPTPLGPTFEEVDAPLPDDVRDRRQLGYLAAGVVVVLGLAALLVIAYLATTPPVDLARPVPPVVNTDTDDAPVAEEAQWPRLLPGDKGRPVRAAQMLLKLQGQQIEVTGRYGAGTTRALNGFAREKELEARIIDGSTWGQLVSPAGPNSEALKIRALQVLLKGNDADVAVNGRYNGRLRRAVSDFQSETGLPVSGVAGRPTWRALAATALPFDRAVATRERPARRGRG